VKKISNSQSEVPTRRSVSKESYVKVFISSIILLIFGVILASMSTLIIAFADPQTPQEADFIIAMLTTVATISTLFLHLGMIIFSLSAFLGATRGETLSGDVRKGLAIASAIGILALGIMMMTIISYPYYF